jgi:hypothetical protein
MKNILSGYNEKSGHNLQVGMDLISPCFNEITDHCSHAKEEPGIKEIVPQSGFSFEKKPSEH